MQLGKINDKLVNIKKNRLVHADFFMIDTQLGPLMYYPKHPKELNVKGYAVAIFDKYSFMQQRARWFRHHHPELTPLNYIPVKLVKQI